jgi:hypothetical protein
VADDKTTASFALELQDGMKGPAASAAGALKQLRTQIDGDTKALRAMQVAMKNLQGGTNVNAAQLKKLQAGIAEKKQAIAGATSSFLSLGGTFARSANDSNSLRARLDAITKTAQGMPGPLGMMLGKFEAFAKLVGGGGIALGIIAISAALIALVAAVGAAVGALFKLGIANADARRNELLHLEGLTKLRNYFGLAAGNAKEMQGAIDQVSGSSLLGRDKLAAYSDQLYRMGLRGENLTAALEGVAIKSQVQGDAAANAFAGWAAGAALTGQSVRKLSDDVKARLGGIASAQMLGLDAQATQLHKSFDALFSGLKIEPLLKGLKSITDLFSQSTASGRALKQLMTLMLQPLIDGTAEATPLFKIFIQECIIHTQRFVIALLKVRNWLRKSFDDARGPIDKTIAVLGGGKDALAKWIPGLGGFATAAKVLGVALGLWLIPVLWGAVTAVGALVFEGLLLALPFIGAAAVILVLYDAVVSLIDFWKKTDWSALGSSIWQGLVNGLGGGLHKVVESVEGMGKAAWKALKDALGIASPSKVFAQLGLAIPMGVELGVNRGAPAAQAAIADVTGGAPRIGRATPEATKPGGASAASAAGGTNTVHIDQINVYAQSDKAPAMARDFVRELESVLEGVTFQIGASPA